MIKNILYDTNVMQYKFWEFYRVKEFNIIDKTLLFKKKNHFMITFYILNVFFVTLYNILQYYKNTFQINAVLSNILELYTKNPEKIIRVSTKKIYIYFSGGPLSALTCCVNVRLLSAIKKISPLIYSQSWVGSWVYTTQAMMTFTLIF